jgi:hypothetical protein
MTNLSAAREDLHDHFPPEWEHDIEHREPEVKIDISLLKQAIEDALEKWEKKKSVAQAASQKEPTKINGFNAQQPIAAFYGNSVNLGPISHSGKNSNATTGLEEISRLISHYEKELASKERRLLELEIDLDTQRLMNDDWDEHF